jgi:hypothetical protein
MKVNVYAYYSNCSITEVELPEGKTWDDVLHYGIKWGTLYITWKDSETPEEFQLSEDYLEGDYKRPDNIVVYDEDQIEILDED